ncbi:MAG: MarR family transcriptional regulator [Dehalococcoidales bacterium]|nr:MarR family transcriptional regulator [Dehalococcoidales bacterium]
MPVSPSYENVAKDLLSLPPLIFRRIRSKLNRNAVTGLPFGITSLHVEIMILLEDRGKMHLAEIGERLFIAKAHMTQLVNKLVEMGLVERSLDPSDRRITNIFLTGTGRRILDEHKASIMASILESLSSLSQRELKDLSVSLNKLKDILSRLQ